jgi:hypothetical protein
MGLNLSNINSKTLKIKSLIIILVLIGLLFYFRNHIRLETLRKFPVLKSKIKHRNDFDEDLFSVKIYSCDRVFGNRIINKSNKLFNDEIMVVIIPVNKFIFKNVVTKPIGSDVRNDDALIYFNTLFFDQQFIATTGLIKDKVKINKRKPIKKRIGIDENGKLTSFTNKKNASYSDVLQAPFTLKTQSRTKTNLRSLNYRQFLSFNKNKIFFISGKNNSLISWMDVKEIMKELELTNVIALDGGASVDYYFNGKNNTYSFSSIPFRKYWFNKNPPYYLEATKKLN